MIASYDVGDRVRLGNHSSNPATTAILDTAGTPVDPAQVSLIVSEPDGTATTYTVGGANALAKETVGRYYADVTLDAAGLWAYALVGAGTAVFREEAVLHARQSALLAGAASGEAPPAFASGGPAPDGGSYYTQAESDARFLTPDAGDAAYAEADHTHPAVTTGRYHFQSNPAMTDPGSGNLRSNTGVAHTATALAMDQIGALGTDVTALFQAMRANDTIFLQDLNEATQWVRYQLTGAATLNSGWAQVPVAVVSSGGVIAGSQLCVLQLTLTAG